MSVSSLVGAALGEGKIKKAKKTFKIILYITTFGSAIVMTVFVLYAE